MNYLTWKQAMLLTNNAIVIKEDNYSIGEQPERFIEYRKHLYSFDNVPVITNNALRIILLYKGTGPISQATKKWFRINSPYWSGAAKIKYKKFV